MEAMTMYEQDLFNEPTWVPPIELPDLSKETIIAIKGIVFVKINNKKIEKIIKTSEKYRMKAE